MATKKLNDLVKQDKRTTGNINSINITTLNHGAKCTEDIDNFTIVELGFDEKGERTASYLTDVAKKGYLIASPERRYLGESISEFFNGEGERARIIYLKEGLRFETSGYTAEGEVENGSSAHFDPATKKFIVHDGTNEDFEGAADKFVVVNCEENVDYTLGEAQIRLEVLA